MPRAFGGFLSNPQNRTASRAVCASLGMHLMGAAILVQRPTLRQQAIEEPKARPIAVVSPVQSSPPPIPRKVERAHRRGPGFGLPRGFKQTLAQPAPNPETVAPLTDGSVETPSCLKDCQSGDSSAAGIGPSEGQGEGGDGRSSFAGPFQEGGQISPPFKIRDFKPVYPELAIRAHAQGVVVLECTIGTDGKVSDIRLLSGHPLLNASAIDAVRRWVYRPTELNRMPVAVVMTVTVVFQLP